MWGKDTERLRFTIPINTFNKIITKLEKLEVKVNDEDKAIILLCSLPSSYDHWVTSLTYEKYIIILDDTATKLLSHSQADTVQKKNLKEKVSSLYVSTFCL